MVRRRIVAIAPKSVRKNLEKGRGLGHVTLIFFGLPLNISKKSRASYLKFGMSDYVVGATQSANT